MIDFRYHLVSIVAVFLALAIGIVLGSTELQGPTYNLLNQTTAKLQNEYDQASSQRDVAQQQADLGENYAQAVEPVVLHNLLAGQRLLIITEPGAPASVVTAISNAATQDAGATVTGQIAHLIAVLRGRAGLPGLHTNPPTCRKNLVFTDGPGTGKSRAARALARLYKDLGPLSYGQPIEIAAADLAGATPGHRHAGR